uniref:FLYWCH-type domain-containing protein n=1 Tax=Globodera rostochiensis TaxID=31243 RepID=A0A914GT25_GLORO
MRNNKHFAQMWLFKCGHSAIFVVKRMPFRLIVAIVIAHLCLTQLPEQHQDQLGPAERTTKAKTLFVFHGYEMRKDRIIAEGRTQVWRCVRKSCTGRAHSEVGTTDLVETTKHNHLADPDSTTCVHQISCNCIL